jgi:hypothetical protein
MEKVTSTISDSVIVLLSYIDSLAFSSGRESHLKVTYQGIDSSLLLYALLVFLRIGRVIMFLKGSSIIDRRLLAFDDLRPTSGCVINDLLWPIVARQGRTHSKLIDPSDSFASAIPDPSDDRPNYNHILFSWSTQCFVTDGSYIRVR